MQQELDYNIPAIPNVSDFDRRVLALTLYAEARGESHQGIWWVAWTIRNRVTRRRWWGLVNVFSEYNDIKHLIRPHSFAAVCLYRWQYSCWNTHDPHDRNHVKVYALLTEGKLWQQAITANENYRFNYDDKDYVVDCRALRECMKIANDIHLERDEDPVNGATHYFAHDIVTPSWASKITYVAKHGRHTFMRED